LLSGDVFSRTGGVDFKGVQYRLAEGVCVRRRPAKLYNAVIFLVVMTIAILVLIYWGGFKEESRNG